MSTPPLPSTFTAGTAVSPYDIPGIKARIDAAVASLRPDQHGAVTLQLNESGLGGGLVIRGPRIGRLETSVLGTVTKPKAGRFGWGVTVGAAFLVNTHEPEPDEVRVAPELRGLVRLMRAFGHGPLAATWLALRLAGGEPVEFLP